MEEKPANIREAARHLRRYGITVAWLRAEAEAGRLPALRVGRGYLFNLDALERVLARRAANNQELTDEHREQQQHAPGERDRRGRSDNPKRH